MSYSSMSKQELIDHIKETQGTELNKDDFTRDELIGLAEDYDSQHPDQPSEGPTKIEEDNAEADEKNEAVKKARTKEKKGYPRRVGKNIIQTGKSGLSTG